jgi:hypothetical protein
LVVHASNLRASRGTGIVHDKDSTGKVNPLGYMGTRSKEVEAASASVTLGIDLPRLELDIQKDGSTSGSDANVTQLQQDIIALGTKY